MKKFTFVLAALAAAMFSFAQETVVKELNTTGSLQGTNNSYAGNCDVTADEVTWNFTGNSQINPWRLGGKSLTGTDRTVYTKTAIADDVTKVEVVHGTANLTVNSFKMLVASSADFSDAISYDGTFTASATATFIRPEGTSWANKYYKFVYNVTVSGSSNKYVQFSGVKFYAVPAAANVATPVLTAEEGKVTDGNFTEAFTLTMTCATEGASIYYTLDGTDPAESETAVEYTEAITISAKSTKVRAIAKKGEGETAEVSREAAVTYCYVNTAATAYTATEAIAVIDANLGLNNKLYVKGAIKSITELSVDFGNATYVITDGTSELTIFRGKYLGGEAFTSEDQLTVGDEVVVYGLLMLYGETYEMGSNNVLVSLTPGTGSRIDNAAAEVKAVKVIENGQMVIIRGGVKYNAQGAVIE